MLEVQNLTVGYPGKEILHSITFSADPGQITAVLGPNGCGKTTLLKSLCGMLPLQGGQILLDSVSLNTLSRTQLAQAVAYLPQNRQIPQILAGNLVLHGRFPYLRYPRHYTPGDIAIARTAMETMGIADLWDSPMTELSGGQQQKVYIAMALAQDTPVVLLDEPTTYLDIRHQLQLLRLARSLADRGKTVIMVIHDLPQALAWGDKLLLLHRGSVAAEGTPEEVYHSGELDTAFGITLRRIRTPEGWHYYCSGE